MSPGRESRREHWDRFWDAQPVEDVYEAVGALHEELARHLDLNGARVLEVGAGSGRDSLALAARGARVTVLDYSESALAATRRALGRLRIEGPSPWLLRGNALELPFADGSFDAVFHQGLLEHFRDPLPLLRENLRVLAAGGVLLVDVPQRWHPYTPAKRLLIALDRWFAGWECSFSARELEHLLDGLGLERICSYGAWPEPGLVYRVLRRAAGRLGLRLPMYPPPFPVLGQLANAFKRGQRYRRLGQYTAMVVGVVARRSATVTPSESKARTA